MISRRKEKGHSKGSDLPILRRRALRVGPAALFAFRQITLVCRRRCGHKQGPSACQPLTPRVSAPLQAIKAMRYGEGGGATKEFEDATALREKQEQELQAAMEEDDDF